MTGPQKPDLDLSIWPVAARPDRSCQRTERLISGILDWLTPAQKVGQIIQADISSATPDDVAEYHLGAVLNGGNSAPGRQQRAPLSDWLQLADEYWSASMRADGPRIPVMWGTDAVHGHNNIAGATIFPHNINLGATRDADLVERIGAATAIDVRASGMDWTFAPSVAVARDLRWGRTFESYSECPEISAKLGAALVRGLQGRPDRDGFLGPNKVIATAKHFVGDGGTRDGRDQDDTMATELDLRDVHAPGYYSALAAGVQTIMASFSSWGGRKMHGNKPLLTDLLKSHWGFDGVVVGDWNGHGQIDGASSTNSPDALMAGLDMYMAPDSWRGLHATLLGQLSSGEISSERLDDAVRRVLRLKYRAGILSAPTPSARIGRKSGLTDHSKLAAEAVQKSAVLLKNHKQTLPLSATSRVLVFGDAADNLGVVCGGWTLSWQGGNLDPNDYPNSETVLEGAERIVGASGGSVLRTQGDDCINTPDAAIFVTGEPPYAEFRGDREDLEYSIPQDMDVARLTTLRQAGVPIVTVFISGRPLRTNPLINASDAFIAGFLPGTQSGALADLIFSNGKVDFTGKLPFSWPTEPDDFGAGHGHKTRTSQFNLGFGLTLQQACNCPRLNEERQQTTTDHGTIFGNGVTSEGWRIQIGSAEPALPWSGGSRSCGNNSLTAQSADFGKQENAIMCTWRGERHEEVSFHHKSLDLTREANAGFCIRLVTTNEFAEDAPLNVLAACGDDLLPIGPLANYRIACRAPDKAEFEIPLSDLEDAGVQLSGLRMIAFSARAPASLTLAHLSIEMPRT